MVHHPLTQMDGSSESKKLPCSTRSLLCFKKSFRRASATTPRSRIILCIFVTKSGMSTPLHTFTAFNIQGTDHSSHLTHVIQGFEIKDNDLGLRYQGEATLLSDLVQSNAQPNVITPSLEEILSIQNPYGFLCLWRSARVNPGGANEVVSKEEVGTNEVGTEGREAVLVS